MPYIVRNHIKYATNVVGGNIESIVVDIDKEHWIEHENGSFINTIFSDEISDKDIYDVTLYGDFSDEQANAFDFLITSIETLEGQIVFEASQKIDVDLTVVLRGRINLENKSVFVSDLNSSYIKYDNDYSTLDATNMQSAIDEMATMVNGIVVTIPKDNWDLQENGEYKNIIDLEPISGNELFNACLFPGDIHTEEQIYAFSELITSMESEEGYIVLTSNTPINVSFRILLYGKINFNNGNTVALAGQALGVKTVTKQEYEEIPESEKYEGIYIVTDAEDLGSNTLPYDGSVTGLGNTVQEAIDNINMKITEIQDFLGTQVTYSLSGTTLDIITQ